MRNKPKYVRGLPCNIVPKPWYVAGRYVGGGGGILEWCYDEKDAQEMLRIMKADPAYCNLSIGQEK